MRRKAQGKRLKGFVIEHRFGHALDSAMPLLHDAVEIFDLANDDLDFPAVIDLIDRRFMRAAFPQGADNSTDRLRTSGCIPVSRRLERASLWYSHLAR